MICGYQNIYDLCENKYNYQYATLTDNGQFVIPSSGDFDPVIRTDNQTGQKFLLVSTDIITINSCDNNDDNNIISAWDCYQIYRRSNKLIELPSLNDYKNAQKQFILNKYNNILENGILVKIDNFVASTTANTSGSGSGSMTQNTTGPFTIRLPCKKDDQIYYANIAALINLWYILNKDTALPSIIDFYNRSYELSYINLNRILTVYFQKLKEYSDIKDDLLNIIDKAETIHDIQRAVFYSSRQISLQNYQTTI